MKEINIFLASSIIDFETERKELFNFVRKEIGDRMREEKNISLDIIKCENIDNKIVLDGMQRLYDREIIKSDIVLFLFGKKAGEFTLGELEVAANHFKNDKEKIIVMCKENPYKSENESLKKLADKLSEHKIDYRKFSNIETIENEILRRLIFMI